MPQMTLLEVVQSVLGAMDSDEVNSISDTVEAEMVAAEAKRVFYEFCDRINLDSQEGLIKLEGLSDLTHPNYLRIPAGVSDVTEVRYDNRKDIDDDKFNYENIKYIDKKSFLDMVTTRQNDTEDTEYITVTDFSGIKMNICSTRNPQVFTSFDDKHLIFDSYNSGIESTIQSTKTLCYGRKEPTFELLDDFVIPLDSRATSAYLSEVTSVCFINIKQQGNQKEEQRARRGFLRLQSKHSRLANPWGLDQDAFDFGMPTKRGLGRLCPGPNTKNLSS